LKIEQDLGTTDDTEREDAVLKIQKYYRGYKGREEVFFERQKEMLFLGMKKSDYNEEVEQQKKLFLEQEKKLKMLQNQNQQEYEKSLADLKALVLENEGPDIKDKLKDERTKWIYDVFEKSGQKNLPNKVEEYYEAKKNLVAMTAEERNYLLLHRFYL
jgi:IQ and AAA domain-containing protein